MKVVAYLFVLFAFSILIFASIPQMNEFFNNPPSIFSYPAPSGMNGYFIREINVTMTAPSTLYLNVTVPYNNSFQNVQLKVLSKNEYKIMHGYNRTWLTFIIHTNENIILNYSFNTHAYVFPVNRYNSLNVSSIPEYLKKEYNHPEYLFNEEVIDPSYFKNISENIVRMANATNVFEMELALYNYIVTNFHYKLSYSSLEKPKTAVETWETRSGDCAELSFLYASMSRALGIPAWLEFGWLYTQGGWYEHAWIETVVPTTHGLVFGDIDLTVEVGSGQDLGLGFMVRDPYRITEWVDDGNSSHLTNYYTLLSGYTEGSVNVNSNIISQKVNYTGLMVYNIPAQAIDPFYTKIAVFALIAILFYIVIRKPSTG